MLNVLTIIICINVVQQFEELLDTDIYAQKENMLTLVLDYFENA